MTTRPQTIQIFLPDGSPRSIKIAEITNRALQAMLFPRNKLDYVIQRPEVHNVGFYFLFGENTEGAKPLVYIGEAEECYIRLKDHDRKKAFWTHAIVCTSQKQVFTKTHVKYLEHIAIKEAREVNRFDISENNNNPAKPHVTESMAADLQDNFETVKVLLSTLGYPVFDRLNKQEVFYLKGRGIGAKGNLDDDGFVVFKGSEMALQAVPSCLSSLVAFREKLIKSELVTKEKDKWIFNEDYLFGSPSTAGGVVLGRNTNGWKLWKDANGITLDELKRNPNVNSNNAL